MSWEPVTSVRIKIIGAMVCLLIFGTIAYFVVSYNILPFDTLIQEAIYNLRSKTLTQTLTIITYMANWQFITLVCTFLIIYPKATRQFGIPLTITAIFCACFQRFIKSIFHRARPDVALHLIVQGGYSFPSGHSLTGLLFYGMFILLIRHKLLSIDNKRILTQKNRTIANMLTVLLSLLIFLIGFSRIYLGVHFPTDVIGGWSLSLTFLLLFSALTPFNKKKSF